MALLHIVYDPEAKISMPDVNFLHATKAQVAVLSIPDNLENTDIYAIARKLAELLLEQL